MMKFKESPWLYLILFIFLIPQCRQNEEQKPLFSLISDSGIEFSNNIQNTPELNIFSYRNFYNGGGVAIGDLNNDGLSDVFFTANMGSNKLFLNKGNWKFEDISDKAGFRMKKDWSTGVVFVDINSDGWLDIFVCNAGYFEGKKPKCQLFINNRDLTFTDHATEYGLTNEGGYTTHAGFFDYDLDGDLDCFIINNSFIPVNTLNYANKRNLRAPDWPVEEFLKGGGDHLYRNDNGKFVDVSKDAGIFGSLISFGLGVTIGDINGDQYPDIYVSNDFFEKDYLYINQKNGTFKEELENWMQHISHSSMGADMADINNDGHPDIFTTDMLPDDDYRLKTTTSFDHIDVNRLKQQSGYYNQYTQNTLQVNNRSGKFFETAFFSGVAASDWSWGGLIFDADNDGLSDIFVCNGIYHDVTNQDFIDFFANDVIQSMVMTGQKEQFDQIVNKMPSQPIPNKFFRNLGELRFDDAGQKAGLDQPSFSNGSAYGDLDNDGDLDLVVNNVNQQAFIYRNESRENNSNNFITLQLKGNNPNTYAVGSSIRIYQGSQVIYREVIPTRGFQSSVDYKQVIGIGKAKIDSVIISWPDRSITFLQNPDINSVHVIEQKSTTTRFKFDIPTTPLLSAEINSAFEKHQEDEYIDFYDERNIPIMLSREGPGADTADVNGDGLTDFYVGGATDQAGQLYIQKNEGWEKASVPAFLNDKVNEDVAVLFFDCDGDNDQDLFVGSGGNIQSKGISVLQHRLYKNDGHGNFEVAKASFPVNNYNISVAVASDVDGDNDLDLFVGSRSIPGDYGSLPESYLFINNGKGQFIAGDSKKIGMVTDAIFINVDGDAKEELVVVGEWFEPKIYSCNNGKLTPINTNLSGMNGWWQSVSAADLNNDGRNDLVLGNMGENCYLQPSSAAPVKLWINDFDKNGSADKIITRTIKGKDSPVFMKRELTEQLPSLKKQNLRFEEYARRSINELFPKDAIDKAQVYSYDYSSSCVVLNKGGGQFDIQKLPTYVQLSCVNAILCTDLNKDGKTDLVMGGNQFYLQPQFARLDASYGHVLINDGKGKFAWQPPFISGMDLRGEINRILGLRSHKGDFIVFQNNDYPVIFKIKK